MRNSLRTLALVLFTIIFVVAVGGGLFWGNMNFVRTVPAGADFFALWKPTQNYIMLGMSPYDSANTLQVQRLIYGHVAHATERSYQFDLPFYVVLLFFPVGSISNYVIARAVWMILLEVAAVGLVFLSLLLSRWRPAWYSLVFLALFGLFWAPSALSIMQGNFVIFQALFVFGAIRAIESNADELAGALLALALAYIGVTGLSILLIGIWVATSGRWRVLAGFLMTLTLLVAASLLVAPSWLVDFFFTGLRALREQTLPSTFHTFDTRFPGIGVQLGQGLRAVVIIVLFFEWQAVRGKGAHWLYWTTSLTAVLTPFFGVQIAPAWVVFTLPALLLVLSVMGQRWGLFGYFMSFLVIVIMFVGLWAAYLSGLDAIFLFLYPLLMTAMLYWVRWWATRPPRLWMDMLSQGR